MVSTPKGCFRDKVSRFVVEQETSPDIDAC